MTFLFHYSVSSLIGKLFKSQNGVEHNIVWQLTIINHEDTILVVTIWLHLHAEVCTKLAKYWTSLVGVRVNWKVCVLGSLGVDRDSGVALGSLGADRDSGVATIQNCQIRKTSHLEYSL